MGYFTIVYRGYQECNTCRVDAFHAATDAKRLDARLPDPYNLPLSSKHYPCNDGKSTPLTGSTESRPTLRPGNPTGRNMAPEHPGRTQKCLRPRRKRPLQRDAASCRSMRPCPFWGRGESGWYGERPRPCKGARFFYFKLSCSRSFLTSPPPTIPWGRGPGG